MREIDKYCNDNGCIHIPLKKMEYVPGDEHVTTLTHDMVRDGDGDGCPSRSGNPESS